MDDSFLPPAAIPFGSRPRMLRLLLLLFFLLTCCLWFSSRALLASNFLPHWYCLAGNARLLWTTVLGDLFIGLSYVVISATLVYILRSAGSALPYQAFFWAFGLFIVSCGVTHFLEIVTIWLPIYWLAAAAKILTAVSSVGTAIVLTVAAQDIILFARAARHVATGRGHEKFRALFMATPLAVVSCDLDDLVTSWNPSAEKMFGIRESDVIGRTNPIIPSEFAGDHRRLLKSTLDNAVTTGHETVRQRLDGSRIPVNISIAPLYDTDGNQTGIMSTLEDISDRKRMEIELKEKSATLLTITQAVNAYLAGGDWKLASRELLGLAIQQTGSHYGFLGVVLEGSCVRVLAQDDTTWDMQIAHELSNCEPDSASRDHHVRSLENIFSEAILSGKTVVANELLCEPATGASPAGYGPFEAFLAVPIYKDNEVAGLIGVANRIGGYSGSEWQPLETMSRTVGILCDNYRQSLNRAAADQGRATIAAHTGQSRSLDLLARVAGGFAHEFNNLLMILSGASELLDRSLGAESLSRIYVNQIQQGTAKAAAITRQLLAFSGKQVLEIRPLDLHSVLADCESVISDLLGPRIALQICPNASRPWISSDLPQIIQVIVNLASNSRNAMPHGGQLVISTQDVDESPDPVPADRTKVQHWVMLHVRDTGAGMDESTLAHAFEPFFTTKPVGKGTGLGLSTVYGVIRQSGGYVQVQSEIGKGTCVQIYFPAISAPQVNSLTFKPSNGNLLPDSATVLLVDDESALVHAIGEFLRECGYIVLDAFSVQDAVDLAKEHPGRIDVLITDVVMPDLSGPDLYRQIIELQPDIQVLFMSGYAECLSHTKLPADARFLQKPFRFSVLLESLRQLHARK